MYMRHGDVYILGVTKTNANVMMAFQFMTNVSSQALYDNYYRHEFEEASVPNKSLLDCSVHQLASVQVNSDGTYVGGH